MTGRETQERVNVYCTILVGEKNSFSFLPSGSPSRHQRSALALEEMLEDIDVMSAGLRSGSNAYD
jgi:hypothetical protein